MGRWRIAALSLVLALLGAACGSGDEAASTAEDGTGGGVDGQGVPGPGADAAPPEGAPAGDAADPIQGVEGASLQEIAAARRIIRNAELTLEVADVAAAYDEIQRLVARTGGFVAGADLQRPDEHSALRGSVVVRVPSQDLDAVLVELEGLAEDVQRKAISTTDVTDRAIDLEAQLNNLRVLEAELQELLAEVRDAGDTNAEQLFGVFERIRQVREQIEQTEAQLRALTEQVTLSTVTIQLEPTPDPVGTTTAEGWRPSEVVAQALASTLATLRVVANIAIWFAVFVLPVLALFTVPVALGYGAVRWWGRRRPAPTA